MDDEPLTAPRPSRVFLFAAIALVVVAVGAVLVARSIDPSRLSGIKVDPAKLPVGPVAPGLDGNKGWLNSPPLGPDQLAGKVVVYDFWTYSCINCVRTLPYVRSWYDRYGADGLVVVGVHSPEFDFEKVHANVAGAVKRLDVTWPVAFDDDMAVWDRFNNNYWPAKYVADRQGHVRYKHFGEGEYAGTEDVLRNLLGVDPASPRAAAPGAPPADDTTVVTPETHLGSQRSRTAVSPGRSTYPEAGSPPRDEARLVGDWQVNEEYVDAQAPGAAVVLTYRAREVNLVFAPPTGGAVDVVVTVDGKPLAPTDRTPDTVVEPDGTTLVHVDRSDLFRLAVSPSVGEHVLRLTARAPGLQAFAFTFG